MSAILEEIKNSETKMDMTPMIDVVFNLIIFFMLITKFNQERLELLVLPFSTQAISDEGEKDRVVINVNTLGEIKVDGQTLTPEQLSDRLRAEVTYKDFHGLDYKEDDLKAEGSKVEVLLRCSRDAQFYHIHRVMDILIKNYIWQMEFAASKQDS